jgi:hypothetical protein
MGSPHALRRIASRRSFWSRWEIGDVRYEVQSRKYMLALSFSGFDHPSRTSDDICPAFALRRFQRQTPDRSVRSEQSRVVTQWWR